MLQPFAVPGGHGSDQQDDNIFTGSPETLDGQKKGPGEVILPGAARPASTAQVFLTNNTTALSTSKSARSHQP